VHRVLSLLTPPLNLFLLCLLSVVSPWLQEVRGFVMQTASFILVGVLVATQVRGFLLQLMRFFHAWSSVLTSHSIILLLAEMMGACGHA
jgi:hypothetical protein